MVNNLHMVDRLGRELKIGDLVTYCVGTTSSSQTIAKIYDIVPIEIERNDWTIRGMKIVPGLCTKVISLHLSKSSFKDYYSESRYDFTKRQYVPNIYGQIRGDRYCKLEWDNLINDPNVAQERLVALRDYVIKKKK